VHHALLILCGREGEVELVARQLDADPRDGQRDGQRDGWGEVEFRLAWKKR
jgi:hypothetical protein